MTTVTATSSRTIEPATRLSGSLVLPGDKSISHRALMLALLADGESRISGAGDGADIRSTAGIVRMLGATVKRTEAAAGNVDYVISSRGGGAIEWAGDLDCGNSGTTMRLFAGMLAGTRVQVTLGGDASLAKRPMGRIVEPLRAMGADIAAEEPGSLPPLRVVGRDSLKAIDWTTAVPSAQVKSSILLAALAAEGVTTVRESVKTRDHTERMLVARGVEVKTELTPSGGSVIQVRGGVPVRARNERVPGDASAAAFWLVASAIHPVANLDLYDVNTNPSRTRAIQILVRMGAEIAMGETRAEALGQWSAAHAEMSEPTDDINSMSAALNATEVSARETAEAIDEVPILCLAATQARGRTTIRGAGELRHKESDRIAGIVTGLTALGARISADGDDIVIEGPTPLRGAVVDSLGDHRLALTFAIAGLVADGATTIRDAESVGISYPSFFTDLERIRS